MVGSEDDCLKGTNEMKRKIGFVTKYALTQGIYATQVEQDVPSKYWYGTASKLSLQFVEGRDVFWTRSEAIDNARCRATKKVKSLESQVSRFHELSIQPKWKKL